MQAKTKKQKVKAQSDDAYGLKDAIIDLTKASKEEQDFFAIQFEKSNKTITSLGHDFIAALQGNFNRPLPS